MMRSRFWVRSVPTLSPKEQTSNWVMPLIKDYLGIMGNLSSYYFILPTGTIPHEIHAHEEEEIIVLLSGELDLISSSNRIRIGAGSFFYYPSGNLHTIECVSSEPATLLVFKWIPQKSADAQLTTDFLYFDASKLAPWDDRKSIQRQQLCESQSLANGGKLVVFTNRLAPYVGYPAHKHPYDLILVLLRGEMHDPSYTKSAPAVIYYPKGTVHSLAPKSEEPIEMLEFQFHSPDYLDLAETI